MVKINQQLKQKSKSRINKFSMHMCGTKTKVIDATDKYQTEYGAWTVKRIASDVLQEKLDRFMVDNPDIEIVDTKQSIYYDPFLENGERFNRVGIVYTILYKEAKGVV